MKLPKLDTPIHLITLPLSKQELQIKPYVLQTEKSFLTTINSNDNKEVLNTFKTLVNSCVLTEDFDIDSLNMNDFFYLLIQIRMKSNGEVVDATYKCSECGNDSECSINLDQSLQLENEENIKEVIKISNDLSLEISNPPIEAIFAIIEEDSDLKSMLDIIASSVTKVIYKDEVFKDFTIEDLNTNILGNLTQKEFAIINECVDGLAKLTVNFQFICNTCSKVNHVKVENILSFF